MSNLSTHVKNYFPYLYPRSLVLIDCTNIDLVHSTIDNETSPVLYEKQGQIAMVLKYNCDNDTQVNLYS